MSFSGLKSQRSILTVELAHPRPVSETGIVHLAESQPTPACFLGLGYCSTSVFPCWLISLHAHMHICLYQPSWYAVTAWGLKLPGCIPFIPADVQLLVTNWVLWTPSISKELTLKCRWLQSKRTHKLWVLIFMHTKGKRGLGLSILPGLEFTCKSHQHSAYHLLSRTMNQWPPPFLAPGTGFMEDRCSMDWRDGRDACGGLGRFRHCMHCALCFCHSYIRSWRLGTLP